MGRTHPTYCEHGKMVNAGSFDGLHVEQCDKCEASATEFRRRATTGYDELECRLDDIEVLLDRYGAGEISDVVCLGKIAKVMGLLPTGGSDVES